MKNYQQPPFDKNPVAQAEKVFLYLLFSPVLAMLAVVKSPIIFFIVFVGLFSWKVGVVIFLLISLMFWVAMIPYILINGSKL